jgi:NAD(P)-dependent dehydrogenase (short-subunit alcohol dehydrogenase family)/pimeloyl-ACP methyl ester carboxylesterase
VPPRSERIDSPAVIEGAATRKISSDGVELAVVEAGDRERPTIVLVHGYPDRKELWTGVMGRLAPRFHVVAYDVRGAGESSAPRGPAAFGFDRLADDLLAVIDAVSPESPVHLVGHDWGGIAGWELAAMPRVASRLASFTTIAGPSLRVASEHVVNQLRRGRLLAVAGTMRRSWYVLPMCTPGMPTLAWRGLIRHKGWRRHLRYVEHLTLDDSYPMPSVARDAVHGANLYRGNIVWRRAFRDDGSATGRSASGFLVSVPVQLVVPSGDHFISPRYYDGAERYTPQLRRRIVPGSHWVPLAQPELLADWIGEFADDVARGSMRAPRPWVRGGGVAQLAGRLALVTGAGSGIGRAIALELARHGARLLLVDVNADAVALSAVSIPGAATFTCDVSDEAAMEQLANRVLGEHGVPDVVVNNAGIGVAGAFLDTGFDDWRRVLDVNLMGVVHGCRLFGRAMARRGAGGHIVNTASAAAFTPTRSLPAYAASKAAVLMLSESLRAEVLPHGIGVTAVCPGLIATNITRATRYVGVDDAGQERMRDEVTRLYERRNFTPERVATEVVRAIGRDVPVAVITPEAKLSRFVSRLSPALARRLAAIDALPN